MARLVFPDEGSRLVFRMTGTGKPLLSAAGGVATVYLDEAGTTLADIQTAAGEAIATSTLVVSAASQLPLFRGPDNVDTLWVSVDGGPIAPCYARSDDRLDALDTDLDTVVRTVNGLAPDGSGNIALAAGAVTDATSIAKGVLRLTGDLGGTADAPTTPTAVHTFGTETLGGVKTFNDKPVVPDATFTLAKLVTTGTPAATTVLLGNSAWATRYPAGCAENMHTSATAARNPDLPVNWWNTATSPTNIGAGDIWLGEVAP